MSRLAKKPIVVPAKVSVDTANSTLTVKGGKETLARSIHPSISIDVTPEGVMVTPEKNIITITGADKQAVGQFAAEIRDVKRPEPYLGKGIAYEGEVVRRKQGKKAV